MAKVYFTNKHGENALKAKGVITIQVEGVKI